MYSELKFPNVERKKKKDVPYMIASILRCIDIGRDRVGARVVQPFGLGVSVTTLLKVFFPKTTALQGFNFLITLGLLVIASYFIMGYFYQKKMLRLENSFDFDRIPQFKNIAEKLDSIDSRLGSLQAGRTLK